jgi:hypothetical protein
MYSNFLLQDLTLEGIDISSTLDTSLNACSGETCQIPINLSSSPLLTAITGNITLSNLIINITTSPTIPSTLSPLNNSIYFNAPTLTCADSSDPDGDTINYLFYNSTTLLQNSTATTYSWSGINFGTSQTWYCKACDHLAACSNNTETRTIYAINFSNCAAGSADMALNLSMKNEENESLLIGAVDYTLTLDSDFDSLAYSGNMSGSSSYGLCMSPSDIDVSATGFLEYLPDDAAFTFPRQYYLDAMALNSNVTQNITLYSLPDALSTAVTFIASRAAQAVQGVLIHLQRYDVATNSFRLVAMGETNANGNDIIYLRLTDAWYRVLAYDQGELQFSSGPEHITSSPYSIILAGGAAGSDTFASFGNWVDLGDISYSLNYSNTTNSFNLIADDVTGASTSLCLKVDKFDMMNGTTNICYSCVESSSASIACPITNLDAYYVGSFIAYDDATWRVLASLPVDLTGKIAETIGKDGAFFAFLLVGVAAFAAIWSAAASIGLGLLALTAMTTLGFVDIAWEWVMGLIMAGIILIAIMYKRRNL